MSIDVAFQPRLPTILVVGAGAQIVPQGTGLGTTMRVRILNLSATIQRLGYGITAAQALANATAPTAAPGKLAMTLPASGVADFEFSTAIYFAADNATGFELTPGNV